MTHQQSMWSSSFISRGDADMVTLGGITARRSAPRVSGVLLAVLLSVYLCTGTANASVGSLGGYGANGVNIRTCANTSCTAVGAGYPGQQACLFYYVVGQTINGNRYWWFHENFSTQVKGYSSAAYLSYYYPFVGCADV